MPSLKNFSSKYWNNAATEEGTDAQLPLYSSLSSSIQFGTEITVKNNNYSYLNIKASDTPQWRWSLLQCRAWIFAVYATYFDCSKEEACNAALKFIGMGTRLYGLQQSDWKLLLGDEHGYSVYALIASMRSEPGAVPRAFLAEFLASEEGKSTNHSMCTS